MTRLTRAQIELIAERFKALAEPARLRILDTLRNGEHTVTAIMTAAELSQANVSKHLHVLHTQGFVSRRKVGLHVYYALADLGVLQLCEIMCGRVLREASERQELMRQTV